jgi:hypothetical protein
MADILEKGLPQDAATLHCILSTHGDLAPGAIAALAADTDDPQAAPLLELLLFPGPDTALALEDAMAQAALAADDLPALSAALVAAAPKPEAVLPDGVRIPLPPLDTQQAGRFVARLAPQRTMPGDARQAVEAGWPGLGHPLAAAARQIGPVWTPAATAFFTTCAARLPTVRPEAATAGPALRLVLRLLADLPPGTLPLPALLARRARLAGQLRRAAQQEQALARSNYETLIMAGNRLPYLHGPDIARELDLADAVIVAVTGRAAPETGTVCHDLGGFADATSLLAALDEGAEADGTR